MLTIILVICILLNTTHGDDTLMIPGDFNIGALFRINGAFGARDTVTKCEKIREIYGLQRLEAALLALDMINNDTNILPGVTLGIEVHDTCSSDNSALRQSLCLIKDGPLTSSGNNCQIHHLYTTGELAEKKRCIENSTMIGVIGPDTSERTIQVQNLLKLFYIPQIGYNDQTPELDNEIKYWTYLRIVPPDTLQTSVIRDILKKFNWTYVATITATEFLNNRLINSFRNLVEPGCTGSGICIAKDVRIDLDSSESTIDKRIIEIDENKLVKVVICFCERGMLGEVFGATRRLNLTSRFIFIASDRWTDLDEITDGLQEQAWGPISVSIHAPTIPFFSKYYTSLKPSKNTRNPWFKKFWEQKFNCTLPMESVGMNKANFDVNIRQMNISASSKFCTGNENLAQNYREYPKIGFVMKAIWAMAHGLHNMMTEICGRNYTGVCPKMHPFNITKLLDHLENLSFSYNNELVTINNEASIIRYNIKNFQKLPNNTFGLVDIGVWTNGTLKLQKEFESGEYKNVTSVCSLPCPLGNQKVFDRDEKNQECCWTCVPCGDYEYVSCNKEQCIECNSDERPNANRTGCEKIPIDRGLWSSPVTFMLAFFAIVGLITTLLTIYIFIKYKDTPVVKASSRELCYVILFSMILAHTSVFIIFMPRSPLQCALSRSLPGIAFTMMYAGLFTKTHRIARILADTKSRFPGRKFRLMSTSAQVAITFFCVAIEIAICSIMLLISSPVPTLISPSRDFLALTCFARTTDILLPSVLVMILHGLCILYTIKTRNVPGNFNEAKFIGFAMLISFVTNITTVTMFSEILFRSHILSTCLTLNASAVLIFLFFPKLYIIILNPEENKRARFITNKSIRTHIGRVNVNITESSIHHQTNMLSEDNFTISGHSYRLRNVAVQTSSKLLQNISSSSDDDDEDDGPLSDNGFNPKHNNERTLPKSQDDNVTNVHTNYTRMSSLRENIFRSRKKFSSIMAVKSLSKRLNPLWHKRGTSLNNQSSTTSIPC